MHAGSYLGGDQISKVCGRDRREDVSAWTRHTSVVLSAIVDWAPTMTQPSSP